MSTRSDIFRSRAFGCEWAAGFAKLEETRQLFEQLAAQWRDLADQLDLMETIARHQEKYNGFNAGGTPPVAPHKIGRGQAEDLLKRAAECQQMAELASTREVRELFIDLAKQWRDMAKQVEHLDRITPRTSLFVSAIRVLLSNMTAMRSS